MLDRLAALSLLLLAAAGCHDTCQGPASAGAPCWVCLAFDEDDYRACMSGPPVGRCNSRGHCEAGPQPPDLCGPGAEDPAGAEDGGGAGSG